MTKLKMFASVIFGPYLGLVPSLWLGKILTQGNWSVLLPILGSLIGVCAIAEWAIRQISEKSLDIKACYLFMLFGWFALLPIQACVGAVIFKDEGLYYTLFLLPYTGVSAMVAFFAFVLRAALRKEQRI